MHCPARRPSPGQFLENCAGLLTNAVSLRPFNDNKETPGCAEVSSKGVPGTRGFRVLGWKIFLRYLVGQLAASIFTFFTLKVLGAPADAAPMLDSAEPVT